MVGMGSLRRSRSSERVVVHALIIALVLCSTSTFSASAASPQGFVIARNISRIYSSTTMLDGGLALISTDSAMLSLNISSGLIYELPIRNVYDLETVSGGLSLGVGEVFGRAYITFINESMAFEAVKYAVYSALYDSVVVGGDILSVGYVLINSTYRILITRLSESGVGSYTVGCPSSCFARKLLLGKDGEVILVGSLFLRGQSYQWSYELFLGKLGKASITGGYIGLDGNDYVVNALLLGGNVYVVVNSDMLGLHIAVIDYGNLNTSMYRVLVDGNAVRGVNAIRYGDYLLIVAEEPKLGGSSVILLNLSSMTPTAFHLGNILADVSVIDDEVVFLQRDRNSTRSGLFLYEFSELIDYLNRFNRKRVSLSPTRISVLPVELNITQLQLGYERSSDFTPFTLVSAEVVELLEGMPNTTAAPTVKPLYTLRREEQPLERIAILVVGVILLLSSITLKYLMKVKS